MVHMSFLIRHLPPREAIPVYPKKNGRKLHEPFRTPATQQFCHPKWVKGSLSPSLPHSSLADGRAMVEARQNHVSTVSRRKETVASGR
ncbi:hypothetical protein BOTBODRAFT_244385 [Botryobasidium botryosum FD-172 SS1]|uniref:Uncharacterized protein n=1 Tax=Botryobasidium botryosum (strain FD-172 SS1) TaxID=930990 RepID=A0A067M499_BOTB1|nr:hypothetical protein BOTBODRAFT_244385 [Botryobasidium botryosum FD-172 SS1]